MNIRARLNRWSERTAVAIVGLVGSIKCFALFNGIAIAAEVYPPSAPVVAWLSSNYLQLVLLPVIVISDRVGERRAERRDKRHHDEIMARFDALGPPK